MWVDYKSVEVAINDDNTGICHVFELRIGMNERILILFKIVFESPPNDDDDDNNNNVTNNNSNNLYIPHK